ncbi:MAG TPA: 3-deoxy-D-manno-octulosonic acid transferase [Blastocatellia bacterium]|nr:3-deoxy-D-manno-octulosonic acid transferase [Blastocatellia bacterium]
MYFLYGLALSLLFFALLPYFIYQAIRHGKYASSFRERLGFLPDEVQGDGRATVWVHAVSVGELLAARALINRIRREFPDYRLVVSTTTMTGQRLARSQPRSFCDAVFYFPFDWKFAVRRALARVSPQMVIILETELWPNFLRECRRRGVKTIIVNGRVSPRSFSRYRKARGFIARVLGDVSLLVMQTEADAERMRQLGAQSDCVRVCGNLKYDIAGVVDQGSGVGDQKGVGSKQQAEFDIEHLPAVSAPRPLTPNPHPPTPATFLEVDNQFALSSSPHLIVAGSTASGEEEILLAALRRVRSRDELRDARLLLAPRHPERFDEVAKLIEKSEFSFARRSEGISRRNESGDKPSDESNASQKVDIALLDTIGELAAAYKFAAVVFVGGSLVPRGGHNVIEPAAYAKPIIVGPHTENFKQIVADFVRANALTQIAASGQSASQALADELIRLLIDREAARAMGARAKEILLANGGATDCTMAAILEMLSDDRQR